MFVVCDISFVLFVDLSNFFSLNNYKFESDFKNCSGKFNEDFKMIDCNAHLNVS